MTCFTPRPCLRRPFRRALALAVTTATAALLAACATHPADASLYQRLGGAPTVTVFVGRTVDRAASDPRTARSFDGIKLQALKDSIAQQICSISGGGCHYEGETMANAHKDAHIVANEFDALVTILREEIDRAGVETAAKNHLLKLLAPMKRDVIDGGAHARGV